MNYRSSPISLAEVVQDLDIVARQRGIIAGIDYAIQQIEANLILPATPLPWWVFGSDPGEGQVHVHFVEPLGSIGPLVWHELHEAALRFLPMTLVLSVTERRPLCTVHHDCWEAGEEMRLACYAASPPSPRRPDSMK